VRADGEETPVRTEGLVEVVKEEVEEELLGGVELGTGLARWGNNQ
jgi:hypothetical protein